MKRIADLLNKKRNSRNSSDEIDEKTVESILFDFLGNEAGAVSRSDIKETKWKDYKFFIRASHPVVASEIWRRREKIMNGINERAGKEIIREIKVK
ncbi:MAG: hypothetical protein A3J76_00165 [Candidatus Moranbacteria bacterium RBG_13_45_13]|nr:MAG: hypothetical protein A3J76_00165 [Candidatus Moranbacteria bacterium RBG_13_45_13]